MYCLKKEQDKNITNKQANKQQHITYKTDKTVLVPETKKTDNKQLFETYTEFFIYFL